MSTKAVLAGRPISLAFRHMDGNGVMDIATYEDRIGLGNAMYVYCGLAAGGFETRVEISTLAQGASPNGTQLYEDLDGNGNVDVIYPQGQSGPDTIRWRR